ncbi:hypothetical protein [Rickettsia endosymbiont of Polydrusus tereticollis]|uniref:hypothetical protein n=1 Tax=Rickettsia endosymbiont of Polydrusus tereticollis TaxID=3066251 RepID=UPI00313336D5
MKQEIIRKALALLGSNSGNYGAMQNSTSISKAENLCQEFVDSAIEEAVLSVRWDFALKRIDNIDGSNNEFKEIENIEDCIKVVIIVPSNLEFYIETGKIYFKGGNLTSLFYYSSTVIELLLNNDGNVWKHVPQNFRLLTALSLASKVAFALYSDSLFADGLKKQYLIHSDQAKRLYNIGYNLVNSGEV